MHNQKAAAFAFAAVIVAGLSVPFADAATLASGVVYTCNANISAATCNSLNSTLGGIYGTSFSDANASIYIQMGSTGLASTLQYYTNVSYSTYANALLKAETDGRDLSAVTSLGSLTTNPVIAADGVALSSALAEALGLASTAGSLGISASGSACLLGNAGCYNGQITLSNAAGAWYLRTGNQPSGSYDLFSAVEHETDEVLGTASCIVGDNNNAATITTSLNCGNGSPSNAVSAADLFRYSAPGVHSYLSTANGTTAYFSTDGGVTDIAKYNNAPNGGDYGDWDSAALRIQNAYGTPNTTGVDITNDGGSEIDALDAVGYNLNTTTGDLATPEPGTLGMLTLGFVGAGFLRYRSIRRQSHPQSGSAPTVS
jgi:PEP-CTERM motif